MAGDIEQGRMINQLMADWDGDGSSLGSIDHGDDNENNARQFSTTNGDNGDEINSGQDDGDDMSHNNNNEQQEDDDNGDDEDESIDDSKQENNNNSLHPPKLSQWKEDDFLEDNMHLTFAKAHRRLWSRAKNEIKIAKKNISNLQVPGVEPTRGEIQMIYQFLFGTKSLLCETLRRHLTVLPDEEYLQFMTTFMMSCKNQSSVPMMHFCQITQSDRLMPSNNYNLLWARIATLGGTMRQEPFWMTIEDVANTSFRSLFLDDNHNSHNNYLIGLDDDKLHFHYSKSSTMNGLKCVRHVKDNRKGFTLHTAAFSALCVPVCVMFQRELEGVQATYMRMMKYLFGKTRGEAAPDLRGITLASDRGYWKLSLLFENILESGANVEGTVQRVRIIFILCICFFF